MEKLQEIFSTREIAVVIWSIIGLPFLFMFSRTLKSVFTAFFAKQLTVIYLTMSSYTFCIIILLKFLGLWDYSLLKDTLFWFITFAFVTLFKIFKANNTDFFVGILNDIFKLTLFIEFVSNFYTFNLWIEITILPLVTFITMLNAFSETDPKNSQVTKFLSLILSIVGIMYFSYSIYKTFEDYQNFFSIQNFKSLIVPVILSFLIVPYFYSIALYNNYEQLFLRIRIMSRDPKIQRKIKRQIFFKAKFNLNKVNILRDKLMHFDLYEVTDIRKELNSII